MSFITCDQDPIKDGDYVMLVQLVHYVNKNLISRKCAGVDVAFSHNQNDCGVGNDILTEKDLWRIAKVSALLEAGMGDNQRIMFKEQNCDVWWLAVDSSFVKIHPDNINNQEYLDAVKTIFNNRYYEEFPDERPE